ncbi:Rid family hydrolase [Paeniglutamicibacter cryotolerans]|uniref:Enamine deaminase RidA (YjgF/YER057c/UK114 family) n=1 Tax=Paeniglutamicibacter cryotolerans TaxID=670079 RepID=A0A839QMQ1_9MICC|nr:Rid family hydrolase [Paeniglutamicibacter cryotolerans]MBB2997529.1 enamine deaminase RidA (YjgF/YER057c/UK114 family) [Paeniglutamicibacter cryotolerans]
MTPYLLRCPEKEYSEKGKILVSLDRYNTNSYFENFAGYCRAVRIGDRVVVSGTAPVATDGQELADLDTYTQTRHALEAALASAEKLGGSKDLAIFTRLYLAPEASWEDASRAHSEVFDKARPANTTLYIHRLIPPGALVEVEVECGISNN